MRRRRGGGCLLVRMLMLEVRFYTFVLGVTHYMSSHSARTRRSGAGIDGKPKRPDTAEFALTGKKKKKKKCSKQVFLIFHRNASKPSPSQPFTHLCVEKKTKRQSCQKHSNHKTQTAQSKASSTDTVHHPTASTPQDSRSRTHPASPRNMYTHPNDYCKR